MDDNIRQQHEKRFVVEDSFTKVTSDGRPHEMMTLIAGLSGLVAAIIILIILISMVACKKEKSVHNCKNCATGIDSARCAKQRIENSQAKRQSISTICTGVTIISDVPRISPKSETTDFGLASGNLSGNLNAAFVNSEFNLADSLRKGKKKMRWHDELIIHEPNKDTAIAMAER